MTLIPVILCGGVGSRLWPVSRERYPKPFMRLADGQSLLQKTFLRAVALPGVRALTLASNRDLYFNLVDELAPVGLACVAATFLLEPFGRDTAAAVAAAALQAEASAGADAALLVLPADHLVTDQPAFAAAVARALALAQAGRLVTFGIPPAHPETGYGYIEAEGERVLRFIEKPPLDQAERYVASGRFLWNSGMFCFTARTLLAQMRAHCPEILQATRPALAGARVVEGPGVRQVALDAAAFERVPKTSLDYALMEKSRDVAVVPCAIGWSDIGSWAAVSDLTAPDARGNRISGNALALESSGCYVQSGGRTVGLVGVRDLLVVDTDDALLVAGRDACQEVKRLYEMLKERGDASCRIHRTVHRPWGTYTVLGSGAGFKIKRLDLKPGGRLSLQLHHHRSEHWVVVRGTAQVTTDTHTFFVRANESTYIPAGHKHRLENPGADSVVIIEVQSGDYVGEDDIIRFDDAYGRV